MGMAALSRSDEERALAIHRKSIILEMFGDPPIIFSRSMTARLRSMIREKKSPVEIQDELWGTASASASRELVSDMKLRGRFQRIRAQGGVTGVSTNCGMSSGSVPQSSYDALIGIARWIKLFRDLDDTFVECLSADDVLKAKRENKMAVMMNLHNAAQLGDALHNI